MANSNAITGGVTVTPLPGGQRLLHGWLAVGYPQTYDSSNTELNLSNFLQNSCQPTVLVQQASGYPLKVSGDQAKSLLVTAYFVDYTNANKVSNAALLPVTNNVNVATNALFIAIGDAF